MSKKTKNTFHYNCMNKTISTVNVDESIQNFFKDYFFQQLPFSMASIKILPFFYAIVFFFFLTLFHFAGTRVKREERRKEFIWEVMVPGWVWHPSSHLCMIFITCFNDCSQRVGVGGQPLENCGIDLWERMSWFHSKQPRRTGRVVETMRCPDTRRTTGPPATATSFSTNLGVMGLFLRKWWLQVTI